MQLTNSAQIKALREAMLLQQGGLCALCGDACSSEEAVLDHKHGKRGDDANAGWIRAVLHRSCNSALGGVEWAMVIRGVKNKTGFANGVGAYLDRHKTNQTGVYHPSHRPKKPKAKKKSK